MKRLFPVGFPDHGKETRQRLALVGFPDGTARQDITPTFLFLAIIIYIK